eukprot:scaffold20151_cov83-Skeletonema_menzelii.AAC.1
MEIRGKVGVPHDHWATSTSSYLSGNNFSIISVFTFIVIVLLHADADGDAGEVMVMKVKAALSRVQALSSIEKD